MEVKMHFEDLLKRISPTLKRITYKLNGHFSFFNDEDLFQEALVHLWEECKKGKLNDKTDSYILQSCYFYLKNYLRKVKAKANRLISLDTFIREEDNNFSFKEMLILPIQESFLGQLDNKDIIEEINNDGLTKREKQVFTLCLEGLTVREMGKRLGISHVRVVKLKNKIKEKCQGYIKILKK